MHLQIFAPTGLSRAIDLQPGSAFVQEIRSVTSLGALITVVITKRDQLCGPVGRGNSACSEACSCTDAECERHETGPQRCLKNLLDVSLQLEVLVKGCSTCHLIYYDPPVKGRLHYESSGTCPTLSAAVKLINQEHTVAEHNITHNARGMAVARVTATGKNSRICDELHKKHRDHKSMHLCLTCLTLQHCSQLINCQVAPKQETLTAVAPPQTLQLQIRCCWTPGSTVLQLLHNTLQAYALQYCCWCIKLICWMGHSRLQLTRKISLKNSSNGSWALLQVAGIAFAQTAYCLLDVELIVCRMSACVVNMAAFPWSKASRTSSQCIPLATVTCIDAFWHFSAIAAFAHVVLFLCRPQATYRAQSFSWLCGTMLAGLHNCSLQLP